MRRREFIKLGTAAAAGIVPAAAANLSHSSSAPGIRRYAPFGKTGLKVSDIAFGGSRLSDSKLVRYAFDRGVTYFDTAESYRRGDSERAVGNALHGVRDQVVIASKTKAWSSDNRNDMMKALEHSLKRLRTDYVDIYYNHAVNSVDRMQNDEWAEFVEIARREGKIRFRGMSGHGSSLAECVEYAIDNDLVDVVLVAFNFAQDPSFADTVRHLFHFVALQPELEKVLIKAKSKGVGVAAMKTLMGARHNDLRRFEHGGTTYAQAALRWVLASGKADVAVISMTDYDKIDEFLGASGEPRVAAGDVPLLARYAMMHSASQCRQGCGICEDSCPAGVAISEVLRVRMYDVDYGDRMLALSGYSGIGRDAQPCLSCQGQPCMAGCPVQIPIARFTREAALRLSHA